MIRLAYYNAINEYTIVDEMPTGKGYADIIFIPRPFLDKPAMVVSLNIINRLKAQLHKSGNGQYMNSLKAYSGNVLLIGDNYHKGDMKKAIFAQLKNVGIASEDTVI